MKRVRRVSRRATPRPCRALRLGHERALRATGLGLAQIIVVAGSVLTDAAWLIGTLSHT